MYAYTKSPLTVHDDQTSPSHSIFDLKMDFTGKLVSEWLLPKDVVHLDSAMCNTAQRKAFLEALQLGVLTTLSQPGVGQKECLGMMKWIVARHVKVSYFRIRADATTKPEIATAFFHATGPHLLRLVFRGSKVSMSPIFCLASILCSNLESVSFSGCQSVDESAGMVLVNCARTLRSIRLASCKSFTLQSATLKLTSLRSLYIAFTAASPETVSKLLRCCPNLTSFWCDDFHGHEDCLTVLANNCPQLEVLSCFNAGINGPETLTSLFEHCPNVRVLAIGDVVNSDRVITNIMQSASQLVALNVDCRLGNITDASLFAIASQMQTHLLHLCIDDLTISSHTPLLALAQSCSKLRSLSLRHLHGFPAEASLVALFSSLTELELLDISWASIITDPTLMAIGVHCHSLKELHMYSCGTYSEAGVTSLVVGCPNLLRVYVEFEGTVINALSRTLWGIMKPRLNFYRGGEVLCEFWEKLRDPNWAGEVEW